MWLDLDGRRARRLIAAAAVAAVCVRLAFGLWYWVGKPLTHDEREYLALAASIAAGRGFTYEETSDPGTAQRFGRAPGYPLFLAVIGAGSTTADSTPPRVKVAQALVGGFTVWLIGAIALRSAGPRAGVAAAAIAAVYPSLVWTSAYVLSEALYSVVALAAALVLQLAVDRSERATGGNAAHDARGTTWLTVAAGALTGAAVLVRPAMLFFIPLAVIWLVFRRRLVLAAALVAATLAVVGPWTVRNARVHGRFVLVASEGGVTFWTGNHPLATGEGDLAANPGIKQADLEFRRAHPGLTSEELEPIYYDAALQHIVRHPFWWMGLLARKAFYTVVPVGPSYALHSLRYRLASTVPYVLILPFAAVGGWRLWRAPRRPSSVLLLALSAVLVCLIFFPQERFRIPVIDPVLILCAAALASGRPPSINR